MTVPYTLDEIARTTDEMVVRRRFDQRNRFWLQIFLIIFAIVAFIHTVAHPRTNTIFDVLLGTANLALIAIVFWVVRNSYRAHPSFAGRWLSNHVTATVVSFTITQYVLLLVYARTGQNWMGWAFAFPWIVVAIRMHVAEHVLLHAVIAGGALLMPSIVGNPFKRDDDIGYYVGVGVINAIALAIELWGAWRLRRQLRSEWTERRTGAREQIRMRDELRYARELQLSMLPEFAPALDWVDLAAISIPATEVGGDYYDYFVDGDRVALVCGDVAGHGMASGLVLSAIRSGFTLLRDALDNPGVVLRRLHDLVAETSRRRMLVTVTVVLLDRAKRRAIIASAGHPPVILRRADGSVASIDLFAPPLGVRLPVTIPQRTIDLLPGDVFVLHSDGVYETRNEAGETYGLERLAALVQQHDGSAESLRDAILKDVECFRGSELQDDDVTVVVAKLS
ncbi:MAG: hypothetical protein DMF56_11150 [Acidobacteria bacterium]|nr:MAG: hypothetical protein DMF56_11150 [Acidobacteriota bacterium]